MRENTDQNNSKYGHFLCSACSKFKQTQRIFKYVRSNFSQSQLAQVKKVKNSALHLNSITLTPDLNQIGAG